jgi:hypothetical protein
VLLNSNASFRAALPTLSGSFWWDFHQAERFPRSPAASAFHFASTGCPVTSAYFAFAAFPYQNQTIHMTERSKRKELFLLRAPIFGK